MTTAAIDLGGTCLRVAYLGPEGFTLVPAAGETAAVPARVWLAGPGDARVGELAAAGPPDEVITTVRADLLADPRSGARDRYYHGRYEPPLAVAGYVLRDAARRAALASGSEVSAIIVGVPATADDLASMRRAAAAAGLTVTGAIAEPVAVALHYGAVANGVDHVLVVADVGGAKVDVTVLRVADRVVTVLGAARRPAGEAASLPGLVTGLVTEVIGQAMGTTGERPETVLLAGGSAALPAAGDALAARLGLHVRVSQPELAVVRGLALSSDFGLLYVTGLGGDPLSLPPPLARPHQPPRPAAALVADPLPAPRNPAGETVAPASDPLPKAGDRAERRAVDDNPVRSPPPGSRPHVRVPPPPPAPPAPPAPPDRPAPPAADGGEAASPAAHPPGEVPVGGPPEARRLTGRPVERLKALRRGDRLLLTWDWPDGSAEAVIRWHSDDDHPGQHGSARCSLRLYTHEGGFEIPAGRPGITVTVEALGYGGHFDGTPPSAVRVESALPTVTYEPDVRGWRRWTATVTFISQVDCQLPPVLVVLGTGGYKPESTRDGEVVQVIPAQQLRAGQAAVATFVLAPRSGTCWLVCLPADDDTVAPVDLRPAALHRLRVRP